MHKEKYLPWDKLNEEQKEQAKKIFHAYPKEIEKFHYYVGFTEEVMGRIDPKMLSKTRRITRGKHGTRTKNVARSTTPKTSSPK